MSDIVIFIVGTGVFSITTTATLIYGYSWFNDKAVDAGVPDGSDDPVEAEQAEHSNSITRTGPGRFDRPVPITPTR
jgi:hypothetical protein